MAIGDERRILTQLDAAATQGYHLKTIVIAGMGFFSDAYDLFVISLVLPILGFVYFSTPKYSPVLEVSLVSAAALVGAIIGQLVFGFLADRIGRKKVYAITLTVMAIGSIGSALASPFLGLDTLVVLAIWRLVVGIGVGGDYPLSATIMSEFSNVKRRGRLVASVFAMQGFGLLTGALVTLAALLFIPGNSLDITWRIVLGLGAVPALATIYFRTRMPETPRFTLKVKGDAGAAKAAVETLTGSELNTVWTTEVRTAKVTYSTFFSRYATVLFGTAACWFLVDVAFYSSNIFNPTVLAYTGFATSLANPHAYLLRLAEGNILIALFASIPGYWAAVALIDRVGRRTLQVIGFGVMTLSFVLVAMFLQPLTANYLGLFLAIYAMTFFFANLGPNTTTFVLPSEVFPTKFRATGHGISAASGKAGAAIATFLFTGIVIAYGLSYMLWILGAASFAGFVISLVLTPETTGRTLEDVSREDELELVVERFQPYLVALTRSIQKGAAELKTLLQDPARREAECIPRIRATEHTADEQVHEIYMEINNKRMKSSVRSDIGALASSLDDIIDGIEGVAARVHTYHLTESTPNLVHFAEIVEQCVLGVSEGIDALDDLLEGRPERLQKVIVDVNRLENEADDLLRIELDSLFQGSADAVHIIKLKDFYERLEIITDRCEDVTDVYKDLIARYGPLTLPG